jgi:hypothetical protein
VLLLPVVARLRLISTSCRERPIHYGPEYGVAGAAAHAVHVREEDGKKDEEDARSECTRDSE